MVATELWDCPFAFSETLDFQLALILQNVSEKATNLSSCDEQTSKFSWDLKYLTYCLIVVDISVDVSARNAADDRAVRLLGAYDDRH